MAVNAEEFSNLSFNDSASIAGGYTDIKGHEVVINRILAELKVILGDGEASHLNDDEWVSDENNREQHDELTKKCNLSPSYIEIQQDPIVLPLPLQLEPFAPPKARPSSSAQRQPEAVLTGITILSGLGTDQILDVSQKGRGREKGPILAGSSRDTASTVTDAARFSNQMSLEGQRAKDMVAS
ncbi:unnamed protein product [Symbiodinium sp. KB8]|nr:unnamed protein product [Symbiodinium sp. KB8]